MVALASLTTSGLAYEQAYNSTDTNASSTAAYAQTGVRSVLSTVGSIIFKTMHYYKPWKAGQFIALGEEAQVEKLIKLEEKVQKIAKEKMAKESGASKKEEGDGEEEEPEGKEKPEGEEGEEGPDGEEEGAEESEEE